jgi:hypothetical protein
MGHTRLGKLPRTYRWRQVINLLEQAVSLPELAQATFDAAQAGLACVPKDQGFTQTLTTIFEFIDGLQSRDPAAVLRQKGFALPNDASLFDYINSFKERADATISEVRLRSDVAEIAQNSFTQTVFEGVAPSLPTFFGAGPGDVQKALQTNLKGQLLTKTMHAFFVTFTQQYLNYYLGRELPCHVGQGKTLSDINGHSEFTEAFNLYIRQTVRITDEFTPGWFGKARYEKRLSHESVSRFAHVAFNKIRGEFSRDAETDE